MNKLDWSLIVCILIVVPWLVFSVIEEQSAKDLLPNEESLNTRIIKLYGCEYIQYTNRSNFSQQQLVHKGSCISCRNRLESDVKDDKVSEAKDENNTNINYTK